MNPEELGILFNPEAEKSVLGAMLINNECIERMDSLITGDDFYFPENGQLYDAITAVYKEDKGVDPTTVMDRARRKGAGNLTEEYIKNILNSVYTSANAKEYAEIVKDFSIRRKLQTLGDIIRGAACELQTPVLDTMNRTASMPFTQGLRIGSRIMILRSWKNAFRMCHMTKHSDSWRNGLSAETLRSTSYKKHVPIISSGSLRTCSGSEKKRSSGV